MLFEMMKSNVLLSYLNRLRKIIEYVAPDEFPTELNTISESFWSVSDVSDEVLLSFPVQFISNLLHNKE